MTIRLDAGPFVKCAAPALRSAEQLYGERPCHRAMPTHCFIVEDLDSGARGSK
jgi:hypothetical protein